MADEWREMALTVTGILRKSYTSESEEALRLIGLAITKLKAQHTALISYRLGMAHGYVDLPNPAGVFPDTLLHLEYARRRISRSSTLHGLAANAFPACCEGMDLVLSAEMGQSWNKHSDDALTNADDAQMRLCNAASFAQAARDAVDMAAELPAGVTLRIAWLIAADKIQGNAIDELYQARSHVREMQDAISLLFLDARSILGLD